MSLAVIRRYIAPLLLAAAVLVGCSSAGGGDVIKPEPTKNPMQNAAGHEGQNK